MATKKATTAAKKSATAPKTAVKKTAAVKTATKKVAAKKAPAKKAAAKKKAAPTHEEIAKLAHHYFSQRGHTHGSHEEDWARAVRELS